MTIRSQLIRYKSHRFVVTRHIGDPCAAFAAHSQKLRSRPFADRNRGRVYVRQASREGHKSNLVDRTSEKEGAKQSTEHQSGARPEVVRERGRGTSASVLAAWVIRGLAVAALLSRLS